MLEGTTPESRVWRETVDIWWAEKLNIRNFTPRFALQHLGTDVLRQRFNNDIWLLSLEKRFLTLKKPTVLTDCRFQNEIELVKQLGGSVIQVDRGEKPDWWEYAVKLNVEKDQKYERYLQDIEGIHPSEYSWIGSEADVVISNNGTLDDLREKTHKVWEQLSCE